MRWPLALAGMSGFASSSPCGCRTTSSRRSRAGRPRAAAGGSSRREPARHARLSRLAAGRRAPGDPRGARAAAADAAPPRFEVTGYRETRSVGMLTLADEAGAAATLAGRLHDGLEAARRLPARGAAVAAARDRPPLPRAPAAAAGAAGAGLGVVRRGCFPFPSAPVRGAVRGARLISARRLIR